MDIKILLFLLFPSILFAQDKDTVAMRYSRIITKEDLKGYLTIVSDDAMEGRETGKDGQKKCADFIQSMFRSFGIPPYRDNTYYQEFPLDIVKPTHAEVSINKINFIANKDFYNYPGQSEQQINSTSVLFLGYGIDDDKYSDYKGIDVKGKVVMILSGEPFRKDSTSFVSGKKDRTKWSYYKTKPDKAKEKGVSALLIVVDNVEKDVADNKHRLESESMKLEGNTIEMPVIYISKEMANAILKKKKIDSLKEKILASGKPLNLVAKTKIEIGIKSKIEKVNSENVLGYIEGGDLKNELIIVTAHYDHLGKSGDVVFNGADDDGSGTVGVMELAQAFAKAKKDGHGPRRSILFMTVAGEEKGLLGSSYYVQHPEFPIKNTVCDLNIDMIGRQDEKHKDNANYIYVIGDDKLSSQLHTISESANKLYENLELDYTYNDVNDKNRFYYRSDHYNFAKNGIPIIFYFNGVHEDYHKATDKVEKINFDKMEKITRLVFYTAWELANRNERIVIDSDKK